MFNTHTTQTPLKEKKFTMDGCPTQFKPIFANLGQEQPVKFHIVHTQERTRAEL